MTNSFISNNICFFISSYSEWKLFYKEHKNIIEEIYRDDHTGLFTLKNKNIIFHITGIGNNVHSNFMDYTRECDINYFINIGFSGAINNSLEPTTIVIPDKYINASGKIFSIPQYYKRKGLVESALLFTADHPVHSIKDKSEIKRKYNADLVDMEYGLYRKHIEEIASIKIISDNANKNTYNDFKLNLNKLRIQLKEIIEDIIF